ncbi:cytochrome c oxidase subunit 7A-related protein, mitochondrial-like [Stylophora pistillata]|uniref:Cytochrome c oxidase subunit 7A-related protein, mitochondrial n=1 Tax=Stylophora pistillata TaxID=50429 RepID=A0A2B4RJ04_STYPI|nr:cytochrome c oxidase subunit 7A-related protein, mitochondrial-like [Stylophora pistillata]PFX17591.1 Cytochrome c oxidase subunit 7A-related protein, mitochondrial [Stylophora pistillata]
MFYKQSPFAGRVVSAEATTAYQPQGLGKYSEPKPGPVFENPMSSSSGISGENSVRHWQDTFKQSKAPVYLLRGTRDKVIYRGLMGVLPVGMGVAAYYYYMMSTGKLKRKER